MEYVRERHPAERSIDAHLGAIKPDRWIVIDCGEVLNIFPSEEEAHAAARQRRDAYKPEFQHFVFVLAAGVVPIKEAV